MHIVQDMLFVGIFLQSVMKTALIAKPMQRMLHSETSQVLPGGWGFVDAWTPVADSTPP